MSRFPLQTFLRNARTLEKHISLALTESMLSQSQYRLLAEFSECSTLTVSELSDRLNIAKPSVTNLVKQLDAMGLINLKIDQNDQRSKRLTLTRNGNLRLKTANKYLAVLEKRLAKNFSTEQLITLQNLEIKNLGS